MLICAVLVISMSCGKKGEVDSSSENTKSSSDQPTNTTERSNDLSSSSAIKESGVVTTGTGNLQTKNDATTTTKENRRSATVKAVLDNIKVAQGTKKIESGLNFGGKTFTFLIWSEVYDSSWKPMLESFGKQYNCKIDVSTITFSNYLTAISTAISSGKPYDIIRMHGSLYPRVVISNLLEPMENGFTTADLVQTSNPNAGGIDLEKSKYFAWGNKLYAVCERKAAPLQIMLYNKLKFQDDLGVDPLELYKNKQWSWSKIKELGQKVTKPESNIYFGDASFCFKMFTLANDAHMIKKINGELKENLLDANMFNALKYVQSIAYGKDAILTKEGSSDDFTLMKNGSIYMFCTETTKIPLFAEQAAKSQAFGMKASNLGVVPLPLGPDNKSGAYPANWLVGFSASRTKDVRPAIALMKFKSTWNSSDTTYTMDSFVKSELDKFYDNINYCDFGFNTADTKLDTILYNIEGRIAKGEDITKVLKEKQSAVQSVIDSCLQYQ